MQRMQAQGYLDDDDEEELEDDDELNHNDKPDRQIKSSVYVCNVQYVCVCVRVYFYICMCIYIYTHKHVGY